LVWPLLSVSLLWGLSNPLMKRGSKGITELRRTGSPLRDFLNEYYFLFTRPLYLAAFLINVTGSVLYYYSLANREISLIVTTTNSLTFLVTTLTSKALGEEGINFYTYLGMVFVLAGVGICLSSNFK